MKEFYNNKKVLITGDTGFKGSVLSYILMLMGADVTGYALCPPTNPSMYDTLKLDKQIRHMEGDIRDFVHIQSVFRKIQPEIVFHLAAQPLVRESYQNPVYTYETNVLGTVYMCECIRKNGCVKSFLNVTTDKVYQNDEEDKPFLEDMPLNGRDPYSNSKSCSELVTYSYLQSFYKNMHTAVSTARAGNVVGGGDFAANRIIPDCVRAAVGGNDIIVRNPHSIRPYQHVLEPLYVYLMIAKEQYQSAEKQGNYNVGPDDESCITTGELADLFCKYWGEGMKWVDRYDGGPYEAGFLKLDCTKLKETFAWQPRWNIEQAVEKSVEWYKAFYNHEDMGEITKRQIGEMFDV